MKALIFYKDLLKNELLKVKKEETNTYNQYTYPSKYRQIYRKITPTFLKKYISKNLNNIKLINNLYLNNLIQITKGSKILCLDFLKYCVEKDPEIDFDLFDTKDKNQIETFVRNKFLITIYDFIPKNRLFNLKDYTTYNQKYNILQNKIIKHKKVFSLNGFKSIKNDFEPNVFYHEYGLKYFNKPFGNGFILDIGAYIGDSSWLFTKKTKCKILAIEPDPHNYKILTENIKINNMVKEVTPLKLALGLKESKAKLNLAGGPGTYIDYDQKGPITITTIDNIIKNKKINNVELIKMDIEGFELDTIKGGEKTI
ncbi:MAG: FkbM family methyltransferase [DPANN group archaeon]|nr:FkbM family methyltransferase [DPANN group archaeon]